MTCPHGRLSDSLCPHCWQPNGGATSNGTVTLSVTEAVAASNTVTYRDVYSNCNCVKRTPTRKQPSRVRDPEEVKREQRQRQMADARRFNR